MTLREIHERAKRRHSPGADDRYCDTCRQKCPCPDFKDAVAALAILNNADFACGCSGEPGTFHLATADEDHPGAHPLRLVPDPPESP